ncbi:hypothetical protein [Glutamicibacter sp. M10]|uniref:hypothetical protein n=1 Tax=Glutamicibacter sp. M10 TaxID=3023076 RepID=UPI0021C7D2D2|nr:hypothetical protein [Glutamicibacter sp. M10]UXN30996.1 hypothetical protein N6V40_11240 [Glutamicibacter sp. M10]
MSTTREARHLSGADLGKTISYKILDPETRETITHTGRLVKADHQLNLIEDTSLCDPHPTYSLGEPAFRIELLSAGTFITANLSPDHPITITGEPSPTGLDLHRSVLDQNE